MGRSPRATGTASAAAEAGTTTATGAVSVGAVFDGAVFDGADGAGGRGATHEAATTAMTITGNRIERDMKPILSNGEFDRKRRRRSVGRNTGTLVAAAFIPLSLALSGCASGSGAEGPGEAEAAGEAVNAGGGAPAPRENAPVTLGIDVLLSDSLHLVRGRRVGLITNHTGLSWSDGATVSTIDRLAGSDALDLVALFSPEHGIRGSADAGETVGDEVDPRTGLPIHSLYGDTRRPTAAMLDGIDVLAFDIQDIGARYYTYVWTMALAMEAAGEAGVRFLVLDRPNPLSGALVQGNALEPEYSTFVGLYPVPMRHGLTAGELARMLVGHFGVDVDLRVAAIKGWERAEWYDETGLPWVPPSPNMPSLESATHYPGTCLFEGTNLSVGRGTDRAFQQIGAPWLDAAAVAARLNAAGLEGVRFEPVAFVPESPGDRKFGGMEVPGIRFIATDRDRYDPTVAAIAALIEIHRAHPDLVEWYVSHFDRLAGTDRVRQSIIAGAELPEVTAGWNEESRAFEAARRPYLLYR